MPFVFAGSSKLGVGRGQTFILFFSGEKKRIFDVGMRIFLEVLRISWMENHGDSWKHEEKVEGEVGVE